MREKGEWSRATFAARAETVRKVGGGTATFEGETRAKQGKGLDSLVDPKERGVVRGSNNLLVPDGKEFILKFGVAMPVETDIDTTGSMGRNVDIAFKVQPKVQNLLIQGEGAVLKRYHAQLATGVIQDKSDQFAYQRSMFEPDNEVERQMGLLVPERQGGDAPEEYQLALFAAAYLSKTSITEYGLRGYYNIVGDVIGRDSFNEALLSRVFGEDYKSKAIGLPKGRLPTVKEAAERALEKWHLFFLQVGNDTYTVKWWADLIGEERVVRLPRTELLADVQAAIIGMTEGLYDPQSAAKALKKYSDLSEADANKVATACEGIPMGLQKSFENFSKIPMAGARFKSRDDIWPMTGKSGTTAKAKAADEKKPSGKDAKGGKKDWKL